MRVGISLTSSHAVKDPREGARWMIERRGGAAVRPRLAVRRRSPRDTRALLSERPDLGRLLAEWGDCAGRLPVPPAALESGARGRAGRNARGRRARPLHRPVRPGLRRGAVRGHGHDTQVSSLGLRGIVRDRPAPAPGRDRQLVPPLHLSGRATRAASAGERRVLDRRQRAPGHRPRRATRRGLSRVAVAHARRGARSGRVLSERCSVHGRTPKAVAIRRDIYVGDSAADAEQVKGAILATGYRGIPAPALVAGSVESVVEQFAELAALGYTDVIVRHLTNEQPKVLASLARLRKVKEALAST